MWTAVLLPFWALAALIEQVAFLSALGAGFLFMTAMVDALSAASKVRKIGVSLPAIVRLSCGRESEISLEFRNDDAEEVQVSVGIWLPKEISPRQEVMEIILPGDARASVGTYPVTPATRGKYILNRCFFEISSGLGFWQARSSSPCNTEARVYPDVASERKKMAATFLSRGNYGMHAYRIVGQGREFEKLREYVPGDSYEDIHWKATARRGKPITKLYQVERTQEVYVAMDTSRLSSKKEDGRAVLEEYISSALLLGLAAEKQSDLFGLMTFGSKMDKYIRAGGGKAHFNTCREAIYTVVPEDGSPDYQEAFAFIRNRLRKRSLLIFLTSLGDPVLSESFLESMNLLCRKHLVMVFMNKPADIRPLFSTKLAGDSNQIYRHISSHMIWSNLREIEKSLRRKGILLTLCEPGKLSIELIEKYMQVKARQLI